MIRLLFVHIFSLFLVFNSFSQDFKKDMLAINAKLKASNKFSVNLHYKMYLDNNLKMPYEERIIQIKKDRHYATLTQKGFEYIAGDFVLMVDDKFKKIHVLAINNAANKKDNYLEFVNAVEHNFDSVLVSYEKVVYVPLTKTSGMYECTMKDGKYTKAQIIFNLITKLPSGVVFFYRTPIKIKKIDDKPHPFIIKIDYENLNLNPILGKETFSTNKYIVKTEKNGFVPGSNYKNYEIINQLPGDNEKQN